MFILIIFLMVINIISFLMSILILFTQYNYYSFVFLIICLLSFLNGSILFYIETNKYPLNNISEYSKKFKLKDLLLNSNDNKIIFESNKGIWRCLNDQNIILDLRGYLFQKSYLKSYVIRNLRYKKISEKRPITDLFKNKYFFKKNFNLDLVLIQNNKCFTFKVIKNGYSYYGFISKEITRAPFYKSYVSTKAILSLMSDITHIDEYKYKNFYGKRNK